MTDETPQPLQVRFGNALMEKGFTAVPNIILNLYAQLGMTTNEMMFTIHIWQFWWGDHEPFPSLVSIAKRMKVSRRQVGRYATSLQGRGLLDVYDRFEEKIGQIACHYDFAPMLKKAEALAIEMGLVTPSTESSGGPSTTTARRVPKVSTKVNPKVSSSTKGKKAKTVNTVEDVPKYFQGKFGHLVQH